jgi:hypothetical protein
VTQSLALNCEPSSMKAGSQGSEGRCLLGSQVIFDQATWQIELRRSTAGELNQADKLAGSLAYCFPSHASVESTDKRVVFDHIAHRTARERASRLDGGLFGQPWYDACMHHQCHSFSWFHQFTITSCASVLLMAQTPSVYLGISASVRVVAAQSLGLFELSLSVGALVDPLRQYATGEAAAQLAFLLPFLRH